MIRTYKVVGLLYVQHTAFIDANTPEEAESIYEDESLPEFDRQLEEYGALVEDTASLETTSVEMLDGEVVEDTQ